jgi:hypothetical protein
MSATLVSETAHDEALAATCRFLNPIGLLGTATVTVRPAVASIVAALHGGPGIGWPTALQAWGLVLLLGNNVAVVALLLRALGAPTQGLRRLPAHSLAFLLGLALLFVAQDGRLAELLATFNLGQVQDLLPTTLLGGATAFALASGTRGLVKAACSLLAMVGKRLRTRARNHGRHRKHHGELYLCGGLARGLFRARNVAVGAPNEGDVLLYGEQSARRGTLAIGAPGSSKTRSKIYPDLYWALQSSLRAGALVFVTKRRATQDCLAIARCFRPKDHIHVVGIGPDRAHIDITAGMTHESIGDAIQDGLGASHSDFWRHGPSAFVEGFVEIAQALAPATISIPAQLDSDGTCVPGGEAYEFEITRTLPTFLKLISLDSRRLDAVFGYGFTRADALEREDRRRAEALRELLHEVKERVLPLMLRDAKLAEELRQSVLPQLQPFARGPVREAFCDPRGIDLGLLERGHVILIEIDETEHPRAVTTVVRMIFRRIVQMARERTAAERIGALDPVVLLCDEYTNYAASGHVQAWNTVRESNFCATVGITSISALIKQLGGDRDAASAIVANFANKFFFEVDDKATRDLARELIGQSIVTRHSHSTSSSKSHGSSGGAMANGTSNSSRSSSSSESASEHLEEGITGGIWRTLGAARDRSTAIAFVRTGDGIVTDVVLLGALDPSGGILTALPEGYGLRA